jgi:WD40 repeat protein
VCACKVDTIQPIHAQDCNSHYQLDIVYASHFPKIKIWDTHSATVLRTLKEHKSIVLKAAFSPNGRRMAFCANDKTVRVWDPQEGEILHSIKAHPGMMNYVMAVAISPDGKMIASGSFDHSVKLRKTETGEAIRTPKCKLSSPIRDLAFSPDGKTIVVGQFTGPVIFWSVEGVQLNNFTAHKKSMESVALSSNGRLLATESEDKTVKI